MRPLAAVLSLLVSLALWAQPASFDPKTVDRVMQTTMKAWQIPGAAVAIVRNDKVVYAQGYGVKDLATNEPVTADTLFQIASTSKAFTTTALAMLVDEGKLGWDDPVREHLDYFRLHDLCADANVTIRDIVSHRTGLSRHDELWDNSPWSREEVVKRIGHVELSKPFRSAYQYQNIMFIAAGEVVTKKSGMPWDDYVRTRIFQPLGMARTVISDADWEKSDRATGYRYDWKTGRISVFRPSPTATIGAAGAIKSSARDMGNWVRFQLANGVFNNIQLVSAEALTETKTPVTVVRMENLTRDVNPESNVMSYGMGWAIQDYRGELLVSHAGALNGFRTHVDLLPRRNSGFVLMANAGRGLGLIALRNSLADMLSQKPGRDWNAYYLMIDRKADERDEKERLERKARRLPDTRPSRPLEAYTGTYESRGYGTAKVTLAGDRLVLQWSKLNVPLTHAQYDVFDAISEFDDLDEEVAFVTTPEGTVKALVFYGERFERK
jgi:CubicO group peptidase (beta-lactamase class C family)